MLAAMLFAADGKDSAREYSRRASVAYNLGHYDEAADLYESAYRLVQDATLLFNIGQSSRLAGRPERALAAYKGFLRTAAPDDPNRAAVEVHAADMEKAVNDARRAPTGNENARSAPAPTLPPPAATTTVGATHKGVDAPAAVDVVTTADTAADASHRTMLGAQVGAAGREGSSATNYRAFARLTDRGQRVFELGYFRRAIYPMNPTYRYSALYAAMTTQTGWGFEFGALGRDDGWHLAVGRTRDYLALGLRLEALAPSSLCGPGDARVLYAIPEGRLGVPVTSRFTVLALASYRGKLSTRNCEFHPSLLTLDLSGQFTLTREWLLNAGVGHYGLTDFGSGSPVGPWPDRQNAAEVLHLGARYQLGRTALFSELRTMGYHGGSYEILLGAEFGAVTPAR